MRLKILKAIGIEGFSTYQNGGANLEDFILDIPTPFDDSKLLSIDLNEELVQRQFIKEGVVPDKLPGAVGYPTPGSL